MTTNKQKLPLFVYPHYWCNFSCSYCFTRSGNNFGESSYVIGNWTSIIEDSIRSGITEWRLSGGEPLAIPQIEKMLSDLFDLNMPYTITTNGTYIKKHAQLLLKYPPTQIWISFHSEYSSAKPFLTMLSSISKQLGTSIGLNIFGSDIALFANDFADIAATGVSRVKVLHKTKIGRFEFEESTKMDKDQFNLLTRSAKEHGIECRIEGFETSDENIGRNSCVLKDRLLLSIDPDGNAYPCCVVVGYKGSVIGNVRLKSISEIIASYYKNCKNLPCATVLPRVELGTEKCPLDLVQG